MNTTKTSSYGKLVAFFVIAVALVCVLGFAAGGWQTNDDNNRPDDGSENTPPPSDSMDNEEGPNLSGDGSNDIVDDSESPKHYNYLTGMETTEDEALRRPMAFVMDPNAPSYAIAELPIMVELPIENGHTRLIAFSTNTSVLGKIGSLCKTRGYITNIIKYFNSIAIYCGTDDSVSYSSCDHSDLSFDLSLNLGYHYTEYTNFIYTNGDLIKAGLTNSGINTVVTAKKSLPFDFSDENQQIEAADTTHSVSLAFSESETVLLSRSEENGKYVMSRNGEIKEDLLSDKPVSFDNVFILFADAITYEGADSSELVMQTIGGGSGYYITNGVSTSITWCATENGDMLFQTADGEKLKVNRGTSYIGFIKSSTINSVTFS